MTTPTLLEAISAFEGARVLLVGDFMLDSYLYGYVERISPEAPIPVLKVVRREYRGGGASSVAMDLLALGAVPRCVGLRGTDPPGHELNRRLLDEGADTQCLLETPGRPTTVKERLVGLAQHRHRQQLLRVDTEETEPPDGLTQHSLIDGATEAIEQSDIVCIQDYNKGVASEAVCRAVIEAARRAGRPVLVDPASTSDYHKYQGASLITPNRAETAQAVGFPIQTIDDARRAAHALRDGYRFDAVLITLDRDGAYLLSGFDDLHIPTVPRHVYDVTGAGDVVLATLATALATGASLPIAAELANMAGGLEVEKPGVATVSTDELAQEILRRGHDGAKTKKLPLPALLGILRLQRAQGKRVVFTNGCFDLFHRGHAEYLAFCRSQGDVVVVAINSDASVRALKGPARPINPEDDRAAVLCALDSVDYVVVFDDPSVQSTIEAIRPDVLIKGADTQRRGVVGQEFVESYGGLVVLAPLVEGRSSSSIIDRILHDGRPTVREESKYHDAA